MCVDCTRDLFSLVFLEEKTVYKIKFSSLSPEIPEQQFELKCFLKHTLN